jgi:hypothetical protein
MDDKKKQPTSEELREFVKAVRSHGGLGTTALLPFRILGQKVSKKRKQ